MADVVAPEFIRFVAAERRAGRLAAAPKLVGTGEVSSPVRVPAQQLTELIRVAAKRASGLFHATKHTEVVWVAGDSELAVSLVELNVKLADGLIRVSIPVRCDQTGAGIVEVIFAVGSPNSPGGLYASTYRRPTGPPLIVSVVGRSARRLRLAVCARPGHRHRRRRRQGRARQRARAGRTDGVDARSRDRADGAPPLRGIQRPLTATESADGR